MKVRKEKGFWSVHYQTGMYKEAVAIVKAFRAKGKVCYAINR